MSFFDRSSLVVVVVSIVLAAVQAVDAALDCTFTTAQSTILGGFVYAVGWDYLSPDTNQVSWNAPDRDNALNCRKWCSQFKTSPMALVLPGVVCSCKLPNASTPPNQNGAIHAWPAGPSGTMTVKHGTALNARCYGGATITGQMSCQNGVITGTPYVCPACALTSNSVVNGIKYLEGYDFVWSDSQGTTASPGRDTITACQNWCTTNQPTSPLALAIPGQLCVCKWTTAIPWNPLSTSRVWVVSGAASLAVPEGSTVKVECNPGTYPYGGGPQTCTNGQLTGTAAGCFAPCILSNSNSGVATRYVLLDYAGFDYGTTPGTTLPANTANVNACQSFCAATYSALSPMAVLVPNVGCYCKTTASIPWSSHPTARSLPVGSGSFAIPHMTSVYAGCPALYAPSGSQTCMDGVMQGTVTCLPIDQCLANNGGCANGATCSMSGSTVQCACTAGWSGALCDTDINECAVSNGGCLNGGVCTNTPGSRSCTCTSSWTDSICSTDADECATNNGGCLNGGQCSDFIGYRTCACSAGWTGSACHMDINECQVSNGGCLSIQTCTNTAGSRTCVCPAGSTGDACTSCVVSQISGTSRKYVDATEYPGSNMVVISNPQCTPTVKMCQTCCASSSYPGFHIKIGVLVPNVRCECKYSNTIPSSPNPTARAFPTDAFPIAAPHLSNVAIECAAGEVVVGPPQTCVNGVITGALQTCAVNQCLTNNGGCANGATCSMVGAAVSCTCAAGWSGTLCDSDINECAVSNGGCSSLQICTNTAGSRTCTCPPGSTGDTCTSCLVSQISGSARTYVDSIDYPGWDLIVLNNPQCTVNIPWCQSCCQSAYGGPAIKMGVLVPNVKCVCKTTANIQPVPAITTPPTRSFPGVMAIAAPHLSNIALECAVGQTVVGPPQTCFNGVIQGSPQTCV